MFDRLSYQQCRLDPVNLSPYVLQNVDVFVDECARKNNISSLLPCVPTTLPLSFRFLGSKSAMSWNAPLEGIISKLIEVLKESGSWRFVGKHLRLLNRYWKTTIDGLELDISMYRMSEDSRREDLQKILQNFRPTSFKICPQHGRVFNLPEIPKDIFLKLRRLDMDCMDNGNEIFTKMLNLAPNIDSLALMDICVGVEKQKKLESLGSLTELDLENVRTIDRPFSFSSLHNLKYLEIHENFLSFDMDSIASLSDLQSLKIFELFPPERFPFSSLIHCKKLTSLQLSLSSEEIEIPIIAQISSLKHLDVEIWHKNTQCFILCSFLNLETMKIRNNDIQMKIGPVEGKPLYVWYRRVNGLKNSKDQNKIHHSENTFLFRRLNVASAITALRIDPSKGNPIFADICEGMTQLTKLTLLNSYVDRFFGNFNNIPRYMIKTLILRGDVDCSVDLFQLLPNLEAIGFQNCVKEFFWELQFDRGIKIHTIAFSFLPHSKITLLEEFKTLFFKVPNLKRFVWVIPEGESWLPVDFIRCFEERGVLVDRDEDFFAQSPKYE